VAILHTGLGEGDVEQMTMDAKEEQQISAVQDDIVYIDGVAYRKAENEPKYSKKAMLQELEHETQYMSESTRHQYLSHGIDYMDFVQKNKLPWESRNALYKYIEILKKRHLSQSTINYIMRGPVGCFFRMYNLKLPIKLPPRKKGNVLDIGARMMFSVEEITQLIQTAKSSGNAQWMNIMALASIYMLRAGEIRGIKPGDVHPLKKTIVIQTEKGGLLREHLVPSEIAPYIFKYDYPHLERQVVFTIFNQLAEAAGVNRIIPLPNGKEETKGLHAVRHGVLTTLKNLRDSEDKLIYEADDVFKFGRWAGGTITETYNHPELLKNDERIFKHHPFLKYWK